MTVPKSLRKENKLEVLNKTRALATHCLICTRSAKVFPNRIIADDIERLGLTIYQCCFRANRLRLLPEKRDELQTEAIEACELLLATLEVAYDSNKKEFRTKKLGHWCSLVLECEKLIIGWRKSDRAASKNVVK